MPLLLAIAKLSFSPGLSIFGSVICEVIENRSVPGPHKPFSCPTFCDYELYLQSFN
jgi:hypothetical protein